jgi:hypothetical protein
MRLKINALFLVIILYTSCGPMRPSLDNSQGLQEATVAEAISGGLVVNGSFEMDATGWLRATNGGRSIVTTTAHSGTHSLQFVQSEIYDRTAYQDVAVSSGQSYNFLSQIKADRLLGSGI